jgi:prepilin-type N-terminal cleavage/methylation domain-containing protein
MIRFTTNSSSGFTLIELIIAVAMIAIVLSMAMPVLSNYSMKVIIGDSLSYASSAKTSMIFACQKNPGLTQVSNQSVGYRFKETKNISDIQLGGDCDAPTITMTLQATGIKPDPVLSISGSFSGNMRLSTWHCESSNPELQLPESC